MKKILSALVLSVLLGSMLLPAFALAVDDIPTTCDVSMSQTKALSECKDITAATCTTDQNATSGYNVNCAFCCLMNTVYKVTNWVFLLLMLVVVLMIIYGGFIYITSAGSPEKAGKGKSVLTFALIGLAIALLAKILPGVIKSIIGVS